MDTLEQLCDSTRSLVPMEQQTIILTPQFTGAGAYLVMYVFSRTGPMVCLVKIDLILS